jgi:DUF1680 family protein
VEQQISQGISLKNIEITSPMWQYYQQLIKNEAIPYQWRALNDMVDSAEKSGAINNFKIVAGESMGEYYGTCFQDSDVGKWLEAVAYLLEWDPNPELEVMADGVIDLIGRAQQQDGYINTYFTAKEPGKRFTNLRECCEHYCFGHLAEAAVAYYQATGKRKFLDIMCRYADFLCEYFGPNDGQCRGYDGHPEAELALVRMYEVTREVKYLDLASFFLEERGAEPYYYDIEWEKRGRTHFYELNKGVRPSDDKEYDNAHQKPRDQNDAIGHAVKVGYLLTGMAGVAAITGDDGLIAACKRMFESVSDRRMYVTGSIGSTRHQEAFTFDYDLPNDRAYAETCASVALVFFMQRMLLLEPDAQYAEVMERVLYNGVLSGISLDGHRFFYVNPLETLPEACCKDKDFVHALPVRQEWYWCACCPPNLVRLVASVGKYVYTTRENTIFTHLFMDSTANIDLDCGRVTITQKTDYPWGNVVGYTVLSDREVDLILAVRIPSWSDNNEIVINGKRFDYAATVKSGYAFLPIHGGKENTIEFTFDMEPYGVMANPKVKADAGKVAIMMGPIVYCMEETDNGKDLHAVSIDPLAGFTKLASGLPIPGVPMLQTNKAYRDNPANWENALYRKYELDDVNFSAKFIPYSMWGNRNINNQPGELMTWVRAK